MTAQDLIEFESGIRELWESGRLPSLVHLCGGNEQQLIDIFSEIKEGDWIFSTHRTHYHALLARLDPEELKAQICSGDSMFVYSRKHNFLCSAVLAGCCGIAAGVAWAVKDKWPRGIFRKVWCFIGDGGEEEGHFYEAAMFVEANDLPCTFIIEDNNRSVDTSREHRRGAAKGLEHLFKCVRRYHYTPTYPHAGSGCSFKIEFDKSAIEAQAKMTREETLLAALKWALEHGVSAYSIGGELKINDSGCGCCSDVIEPPEELKQAVIEAAEKL